MPDIIMDARAAIFRAMAGEFGRVDIRSNPRPLCINQNIRTLPLIPISCGVMLCEWYVLNANHIGTQMAIYGYARVSTEGQTLAAQEAALAAAGAVKVYKEKISGAASNRRELARLLKTLDKGDTLFVTRLDRLARSTRDLLNILDQTAKAGATFKSLGDTWADTTTAHGRLMLTVLGGLAEFERELIRVRTGEGRVRAKARGVHMGRPFKLNRHQQREAIARREAGEALTDIARTFGVHHTTIGRLRA